MTLSTKSSTPVTKTVLSGLRRLRVPLAVTVAVFGFALAIFLRPVADHHLPAKVAYPEAGTVGGPGNV